RCAFTLAVAQTPPGEEATQGAQEETRVDFYKQQLHEHRHRLPPSVTYHCVDGYYARKKYIDEVVSLDLHAITKLRSDADCVFLYTGPHPKRRGVAQDAEASLAFGGSPEPERPGQAAVHRSGLYRSGSEWP